MKKPRTKSRTKSDASYIRPHPANTPGKSASLPSTAYSSLSSPTTQSNLVLLPSVSPQIITTQQSTYFPDKGWLNMSGPLIIRFTNDYMFRALLQVDKNALIHIICAVLHFDPGRIHSVDILNPIELGSAIEDKSFILDVKVLFDNRKTINLEMQVINYNDWPERSLSYLCRVFDSLNSGEDYNDIKPAIQISFLDFTLFPDYPEFFSEYKITNQKNHKIYTDKFALYVINLPQINIATDDDIKYHITDWARMFNAKTWEELKMLAARNPAIEEAISYGYSLSQDELIRQRCERRKEYYLHERRMKNTLKKVNAELAQTKIELDQANSRAKQAETERNQAKAERDQAEAEIKRLKALLGES